MWLPRPCGGVVRPQNDLPIVPVYTNIFAPPLPQPQLPGPAQLQRQVPGADHRDPLVRRPGLHQVPDGAAELDNFRLQLDADDGTSQLAQDATFCPEAGHNGQGYSFRSINYPSDYLRHYDYDVYIAGQDGSHAWDSATYWTDDTSWAVAQPWS